MSNDPIVIVAVARTPMGGFQGDFASLSATALGSAAIGAVLIRGGLAGDDIDAIVLGCTHYPFVKHVIQEIGPGVDVEDSS